MKRSFCTLFLTCALSSFSSTALAASYTWIGSTSDWAATGNWSPSSDYPGHTVTTDTAIFPITATTKTSEIGLTTLTPSLNTLTFQDNYTLKIDAANTLTLGATGAGQGINVASSKTLTLTNNGAVNFNNTSSANIGTGTANITNNATLKFSNSSNAGTTNISNSSGQSIIFKDTATAANTTITNHSGIIDLSGMTTGLSIGTLSEPGGVGNIFLGGNTLTVGGLNFGPFASIMSPIQDGGISGGTGGSLIKTGTGLVSTSASHSYTGTTEVQQGQLNVNSGGKLGSGLVTVDSGAILNFINNNSAASNTRIVNHGTVGVAGMAIPLTIGSVSDTIGSPGSLLLGAQNLSLGASNTNDSIFGVISGGIGSFIKVGTGTLTLNGANTYTGATTVQAGTLAVGSGGRLGAGTVAVNSGTQLNFKGTATANNTTVINHGTVDVSGMTTALSLGSLSDTSGSPGSLMLGGTDLSLGALNSNDSIFGVISGGALSALTKLGSGILTLNGINTYTGSTTVSSGNLVVGDITHPTASINAGSSISIASGAVLSGFGTVPTLTNSGTVSPGDAAHIGTLTVNGDFVANPGSIYQANIDAMTTNSLLDIQGNQATFNGVLQINPLVLTQHLLDLGTYDILTVQGTDTSGTFTLVQPSWLNGRLEYFTDAGITHVLYVLCSCLIDTTVAYANQQTGFAQTANWFSSALEDRALDYSSGKPMDHTGFDPSVWVSFKEGKSHLSANDQTLVMGENGFRNHPKQLAMGIEKSITDGLYGLGFAYTDIKVDGLAGDEFSNAKGNLYQAGVYGHSDYNNWRMTGAIDLGVSADIKTERNAETLDDMVLIMKAQPKFYTASAQTQAAYTAMKVSPYFAIQPLMGLHYQYLTTKAFKEQGDTGIEMSLRKSGYHSARTEIGAMIEDQLFSNFHTFALGSWEHEFADRTVELEVSIPNVNNLYKAKGYSIGPEMFVAKAGFSLTNLKNILNVTAFYEGRFTNHFHENAGKLAINYSW